MMKRNFTKLKCFTCDPNGNNQNIKKVINTRSLLSRIFNTLVSQYKLIYGLDSFAI